MATISPELPINDPGGVELTAAPNSSGAKYTPSDGPQVVDPPAPDQAPEPDDKPDPEAPPTEEPAQRPSVLKKQSTVHEHDHNWTISEVEKSRICGSGVYAAWNMKRLDACVMDVVLFQWLKKGRKLTIEGKKIETFTFDDADNERRVKYTFKQMGTYHVTCSDGTETLKMSIVVSNAESQLRWTVAKNVMYFGILLGGLIAFAKIVTEQAFTGAGFVPDDGNAEHKKTTSDEMAIIMKDHAAVPSTLAVAIIVIAPLYGLVSCLRPVPLTSYGRGFEYEVHSNVRAVLGIVSLVLFGITLWGWNSYGQNGVAIEHIMHEVGFIAIFIGEQLGSAAGSLGAAINGTKAINEKYDPVSFPFTRNPDCPNYIPTADCYAQSDSWFTETSNPLQLQTLYPFRYGGPPEQLMGDTAYCPCLPSDPEYSIKGCEFCLLQLGIFYQLAHSLAGYEEEGLIFTSNDEMEELLETASVESQNADSYAKLGEQFIATIMRVRMVLVYFMMQIALIASATCAAGAWRTKQRLIRGGGWAALIALIIALFAYSVNKPLAVIIESSVDVAVAANNDLSAVNDTGPLVQILAYCKSSDEDATDDSANSFDLKFVSDLAAAINPNATTTSSSPAAVKDSIKLASATMIGLQAYFLSSPSLTLALGNGVEMLPIINGIFAAVGNIIAIIDCEVAYQVFERILDIMQDEAVETFKNIANAEITLCFILAAIFCVSRFAAFVLDRPRKIWYCSESGRWFRFKAAYNAHMSLLKKKKAMGGISRATSAVANFAKTSARAVIPSFSCINIAMEIAMTFHIFLFMLIPNALFAMSGNGFEGVKPYVPGMLLATALIGLTSTWSVGKSKGALCIAAFGVTLSFLAALSCVAGAAENLVSILDCVEIMSEALDESERAREAGEDVSYAKALTEAQEGSGLECDFGSVSDYAQGMIFCFVNFLLCLMTFFSGVCYLCARNHLVTDSVRKTMLKASKSATADGATNDLIERLGGERTDGLGSSGFEKLQVKLKRLKGAWYFKYIMFAGMSGFAAIAGLGFYSAGQALTENQIKPFEFNQCKGSAMCCNGLNSNCDKKINEVTFAGIHNSMSNAEDGWLSPNNFYPHLGGLDAGYRALMVDVMMYNGDFNVSTPDTLYTCHSLCSFGKRTALEDFNVTKMWLDENPNEVIWIYVENMAGTNDAMYDVMASLGMIDMLVVRESDGSWPTMRSCIENNKRIVFMKQNGDCTPGSSSKCPPGFMDGMAESFDTPYAIMEPDGYYSDVANKIFDDAILDRGTFDADNLFVMEHFITNPVASPSFAHAINWNPFLFDRVKSLEASFGMRVNFISIDYWSIGDAVEVAQENNKLPIPAKTGNGGNNIIPE